MIHYGCVRKKSTFVEVVFSDFISFRPPLTVAIVLVLDCDRSVGCSGGGGRLHFMIVRSDLSGVRLSVMGYRFYSLWSGTSCTGANVWCDSVWFIVFREFLGFLNRAARGILVSGVATVLN
jgi:hypothetical protein